jgi:hypothetical protein
MYNRSLLNGVTTPLFLWFELSTLILFYDMLNVLNYILSYIIDVDIPSCGNSDFTITFPIKNILKSDWILRSFF